MSYPSDTFDEIIKDKYDDIRNLFVTRGTSTNSNHVLGIYGPKTGSGKYNVTFDGTDWLIDGVVAGKNGSLLSSNTPGSEGLILTVPDGSGDGVFTFTKGIGQRIADAINLATDPFDGFLVKHQESLRKRIEDLDERIAKLEDRVENFKASLIKQFAAMESTMSDLQSQNSFMMAQLGMSSG